MLEWMLFVFLATPNSETWRLLLGEHEIKLHVIHARFNDMSHLSVFTVH